MASTTQANVGGLSKILYQGLLDDVQTTIYTAPSQPPNMRVEVTAIWICNTDSATRQCTLMVGSEVTLIDKNKLLGQAPIQPNTTYIVFDTSPVTLSAGMKFDGFSDVADTVAVTILGKVWAS